MIISSLKKLFVVGCLLVLPMGAFAQYDPDLVKPGLAKAIEVLDEWDEQVEEAIEGSELPDKTDPKIQALIAASWDSNAFFETDRLTIYDTDILVQILMQAYDLQKKYLYFNYFEDLDEFAQEMREALGVAEASGKKSLRQPDISLRDCADIDEDDKAPDECNNSSSETNHFGYKNTLLRTMTDKDAPYREEILGLTLIEIHTFFKLLNLWVFPYGEDPDISKDIIALRKRLESLLEVEPGWAMALIEERTISDEEWAMWNEQVDEASKQFLVRLFDIMEKNGQGFYHLFYPEEKRALIEMTKQTREKFDPVFYPYFDRSIELLEKGLR